MTQIKLLGLPTCDTCRKARKALEAAGHEVVFRNIRAEPLSSDEWAGLIAEFGDALVNRKSTTWRGLSEAERQGNAAEALAVYPALMKRPVITDGTTHTVGWSEPARSHWI